MPKNPIDALYALVPADGSTVGSDEPDTLEHSEDR